MFRAPTVSTKFIRNTSTRYFLSFSSKNNNINMSFFAQLFGSEEKSYDEQRKFFAENAFVSKDKFAPPHTKDWQFVQFGIPDNKKKIQAGVFRFDSVAELREVAKNALREFGYTHVAWDKNHASGDSRALHSENPDAFFQAASQFNCLEFVGPSVTPERGITCYINDRTQGPACAIACAGATAFRNYLVPVDGATFTCGNRVLPDEFNPDKVSAFGQTAELQLNGLADVEKAIMEQQAGDAAQQRFWQVKNGYIELTNVGNVFLPTFFKSYNEQTDDKEKIAANKLFESKLVDKVRVGVQFDSEVTDFRITAPNAAVDRKIPFPTVGQVFASACSIGYSRYADEPWEPIAKIALKGAYEATLYAYIIHACRVQKQSRQPRPLFLTKLGGGVFSNPTPWICDAMIYAEGKVDELFAGLAAHHAGQQDGAQAVFKFPVYLTHFRDVENGYEKYIPK